VQTGIWRALPWWHELLAEVGGDEAAAFDKLAVATPLGRYATVEETAGQIAWLLSGASGSMTGAAVVTDGGYTL
jgi:NAD(P)-dependent dehydrogenase (short-subunit alcohol dehydrogenase family)